ncbi:MAG: futalosine hydrolase [Nitrospirota bacterium]
MVGIVVSTELEADLLLGRLAGKERLSFQHKTFYRGALKGKDAVICICGIGKANAAHGTTLLVEKCKPGFVYSIGVAGAYPSSGLGVGDIAVAERDIYGDEGLALRGSFCTMETLRLPLLSAPEHAFYNEFPLVVPDALRNFTPRGNFITVSSCSGTLEQGHALEQRFHAICESMEGAAVAHICALNGIPVAEMRGISNIIEDRTATPLDKNDILRASENVQKFFLERVIER